MFDSDSAQTKRHREQALLARQHVQANKVLLKRRWAAAGPVPGVQPVAADRFIVGCHLVILKATLAICIITAITPITIMNSYPSFYLLLLRNWPPELLITMTDYYPTIY